jgi:hypothetical protein
MNPEEEYYDSSLNTERKIFSLRRGLIYLSEWSSEQGIITKYSIDIEKADDSHYEISAEEMGKLAGYLHCKNNTTDFIKALSTYYRKIGEHDFVALLDDQQIKYSPYHFNDWWDEPIS